MLRRPLVGKEAAITFALRPKPTTNISGGVGFFSAPLPGSSSDPPLLTALFRCYGIRERRTNFILGQFPELRTSKVVNSLRPKLDFLSRADLTAADIRKIVVSNPRFLISNSENSIFSYINFLKAILPSKDALIRVLKRSYTVSDIDSDIGSDIGSNVESNIEVLKQRGVDGTWIVKELISQAQVFTKSKENFLAAVELVEDLGLSPNDGGPYVRALRAVSFVSRSTFLRKVEVYKKAGLSEEQAVGLIRKHPGAMGLPLHTIKKKVEFFRDKAKWGAVCLSSNPHLFCMSLEKRIIPRCAVLNILISKGLLEKDATSPSWMRCTDRSFFDRYVHRYAIVLPDVVNAFGGHIDFQGWDWLSDQLPNTSNNSEEEKKEETLEIVG